MNDEAGSTLLERYARKNPRAVHTDERQYRAYGPEPAQNRQSKLQIRYRDGTIALLSYAYLMEVICTSHQFVSLIYTNCVITLEGRQLTAMVELLQDDKIRWLQCFHAARFDEAAEGEPVITHVTRQSMRDFLAAEER